ncbi:MAG: hypothetical protein S4CHLAM20_09000 [Chlamydiia bacterium]|nr:hypothetical protein [Chlamydiia bacterium]
MLIDPESIKSREASPSPECKKGLSFGAFLIIFGLRVPLRTLSTEDNQKSIQNTSPFLLEEVRKSNLILVFFVIIDLLVTFHNN